MPSIKQETIDFLVQCEKIITVAPTRQYRKKRGHLEKVFRCTSMDGAYEFLVFIRINSTFPENFSVGLVYTPKTSKDVTLLRCNGPHGEHINNWPKDDPHYGYHIHKATEEQIAAGRRAEGHAELTDAYSTVSDAITFFVNYCNISNAHEFLPEAARVTPLSFLID